MAVEDNQELETQDAPEIEPEQSEGQEVETEPTTEESEQEVAPEEEGEDGEEGEISLTIDGQDLEVKKEEAPSWVKELRKSQRQLAKENRQLKKQLEQGTEKPDSKTVELGRKPDLADDDIDFDSDKYEAALTQWLTKKNSIDAQNKAAKEAQEAEAKAWQDRLEAFESSKAELPFDDYDDVESVVSDTFTPEQQAIIIQGSDKASLLVYAAGKDKERLKSLSEIKDPVKFAFALGKLEAKTNMSRRSPVKPDKKIDSGGGYSSSDNELEKLREKAAKDGDYSKVAAYKRKLKQKK